MTTERTSASWKKTEQGFELQTRCGVATLAKSGTKWVVTLGSDAVTLPRRASFDHAEKVLRGLGAL